MDDEDRISFFEEIDAGSGPRRNAPSIKWELLLGMALIIGVLAWAGWLWLQQEDAKNHYQLAEKAEAAYDWDTARSEYLLASASGLRDARLRAENAAGKIDERGKTYEMAEEQSTNGQWIEALGSLNKLKDIQPGYRDSAALTEQAKQNIYSEALSGSIASRPDAQPPGLYYGAPGGQQWLKGSDAWSQVRAIDPYLDPATNSQLVHVIYDVPRPGWTPPVDKNGETVPLSSDLFNLAGRGLVAASVGGETPDFQALNFDPARYGRFVSSARGVWATRTDFTLPEPIAALPFALYYGEGIAYQAFRSVITTTIELPGANATVLALDPAGRNMLFAQWDTPKPAERADLLDLRIYLATPVGRIVRMVYEFKGGLATAQISPDGKYALLRTYMPTGSGILPQKQDLVLLNLARFSPPRVLSSAISRGADIADTYWSSVGGATFITHGKLTGLVLTVDWSGGKNVIRLIDPTQDQGPLVEVSIDEPLHFVWASSLDNEQTLLLGGMSNLDNSTLSYSHAISNSVTMAAVSMGSTLSTRVARFATDGSVAIRAVSSKGDTMLYELEDLENLASSSHRILYSMNSLPLASLGTRQVQLTGIYSAITNVGQSPQSAAGLEPNWYAGPGLLAYVKDGVVHARSYENPDIDIALNDYGRVSKLYDRSVSGAMDVVR